MRATEEDADLETASAGYARRFDSSAGRWMLQRQLDITLDLLRDSGRARILDVGGGHGQIAPALAQRGHDVTVLASSAAAVADTLRPSVESGAVRLLVGSLREPPAEPRSFDVVLSYRLLAHAYDLPGLITGLARTARRTVIVDYATSRSFNAVSDLLFSAKKRVEKNTRSFRVLQNGEIVRLFRENNYRSVARRPQFFWPMALHRVVRWSWIAQALEAPVAVTGLRAAFGSPIIARFDRV